MTEDADELPFEITLDKLDTGLRDFPVGHCTTSTVHPTKGLHYAGTAIDKLASWEPQEVIYLLQHRKKGSAKEVKRFYDDLQQHEKCTPELIKQIRMLPRSAHPMKLFSIALLLCGALEGTGDYRKDCLNLIAKAPEIAAAVINYHAGNWGALRPSCPELGYMENFVQMLNVPNGDEKALTPVFKLFNILHYDHGGGNLSTFVGKAVASGLEDMYGSMSAAMCALAGPRHGKANQECLEFVQEVLISVGPDATPKKVEAHVRSRLESKQLVFGFGHAVLRVEDPRATVQYDYAKKHYPNNPLVKIALMLRSEGVKVLKEKAKASNPYPNVDAISGTLLTAAGFPYPAYYTVLFGLSRIVGIAIQIVYERCEVKGSDGKVLRNGLPIVRPKYLEPPIE